MGYVTFLEHFIDIKPQISEVWDISFPNVTNLKRVQCTSSEGSGYLPLTLISVVH